MDCELNAEFFAVPISEGEKTLAKLGIFRMRIGKAIIDLVLCEVHAQRVSKIIFQPAKEFEGIECEELYGDFLFRTNGKSGVQIEKNESDFLLTSGGGKEWRCVIHCGSLSLLFSA